MASMEKKEECKSFQTILKRFANRTSMQGVSFLSTSRSWFAKIMWTCLFLSSLGLLTWHLSYLIDNYRKWPKHSSVNLGFKPLQFPAVSICNINPLRRSKLDMASKELRYLVHQTDPGYMAENMENFMLKHQWDNYATKATTTSLVDTNVQATDEDESEEPSTMMSFINNLNFTFSNTARMNLTMKQRTEEGAVMGLTEKSASSNIQQEFEFLFVDEPRKTRTKMGHQINDMVLDCSFSCQRCYPKNFTRKTSSTFGNCYTLDKSHFKSKRSGPRSGLNLIVYLESSEFLRGVTTGNGIQVVVHDHGTMPFPVNDGIAIAAGTETNVALRLLLIQRLGPPNWDCENGIEFQRRYNLTYTRQTCQAMCEQQHIVDRCNCYDNTEEELNMAMNHVGKYPACNASNLDCLIKTTVNFENGKLECDCGNPCSETKYEKTLSSRQWPSDAYAQVLVKTLCQRKTFKQCQNLSNYYGHDKGTLRENFIKLNVYYEDLNYEKISEEQDYEFIQFVADVGGTLGLWLGLSVLSVFEVLQLLLELVSYCTCGTWLYKRPDDYTAKKVQKQELVATDSTHSEKFNLGFSGY